MTRYTFIKKQFSSGYFIENAATGANTICEYDLSDTIAANDPVLNWDGPKYSIESTIVAVPPKFELYVDAYMNSLAMVNVAEAAKRIHCVLTATIVEYYKHGDKHGIDLYKYLLSEFVFDSIYNMPNRFPKTRSFVDTLCYWHGEIEYFEKDRALPFRDLLFDECISSWRKPSASIFCEDFLSICQVLYRRKRLEPFLSKLETLENK